jgi:tRNA C32,U32 (ribose-2'-O)-methylase TrmJ
MFRVSTLAPKPTIVSPIGYELDCMDATHVKHSTAINVAFNEKLAGLELLVGTAKQNSDVSKTMIQGRKMEAKMLLV